MPVARNIPQNNAILLSKSIERVLIVSIPASLFCLLDVRSAQLINVYLIYCKFKFPNDKIQMYDRFNFLVADYH